MNVEQRKYVRFLAKDNTFAALRSGFNKVGKVIDISIKGLGFTYLSGGIKVDSELNSFQVDIFLSDDNFYLSKVPCKIVYDIQDATPDKGGFFKLSRCGLQFDEITESHLNILIKEHRVQGSSIENRYTESLINKV